MIFFKRFADLLLFGNLYVALGAVSLIQSTSIQLGFSDPLLFYSILVFFSTVFIYNLQRIFYSPHTDESFNSLRRKWISKNQITIKILCLSGLAGLSVTLFFMDVKIFYYLMPLLLLSLAYFIPSVKLRKNAVLKLFTLVAVWTTATAVIPILLNNGNPLNADNCLHILVRFTFMISICIPFDIRDLKIDEADTISTLPRLLGEKTTRRIALGFVLIYCLLLFFEYERSLISSSIFIVLLCSAFISGTLVWMSNSKRNEYFYVAGLDGTMILQGILLLLVSCI